MKVSRSGTVGILIGLVFASMIFANLLSVRYFSRIDLTKDSTYTLSEASKQTMKSLEEIMVVTAYFTDGLPAPYASYSRYVRDVLEEYHVASDGKLAFEFVDPAREETDEDKQKKRDSQEDIFGRVIREPTEIESDLVRLGLQPVEIRVIEDDQQQTKRAYMGLVIRYQGKKEVLPVVQDFGAIEKNLTLLMRQLVRKKTPVVGLIADSLAGNINSLKSMIARTAEVREIDGAALKEKLDGLDVLLVLGTGRTLSEDALRVIDAYVVKGNNVAFFIDQHEIDPQSLKPNAVVSDGKPGPKLADVLASYGVKIGGELVADTLCASLNMQEQRDGMIFGVPVRYPLMPQALSLDQENPVTSGLPGAIFPFASPLTVAKDKGLQVSTLAMSSKNSWLESEPLNTDPTREWQAAAVKATGPYALYADLRGQFTSHFGQVGDQDPSPKHGRMLVAGTSAFAWDQFLNDENQAFVMSSIDYLLADEAMIAMRNRNFVDIPLDPELTDERRTVIKFANILGVPVLLFAFGIFRWRRRERARKAITVDSIT